MVEPKIDPKEEDEEHSEAQPELPKELTKTNLNPPTAPEGTVEPRYTRHLCTILTKGSIASRDKSCQRTACHVCHQRTRDVLSLSASASSGQSLPALMFSNARSEYNSEERSHLRNRKRRSKERKLICKICESEEDS